MALGVHLKKSHKECCGAAYYDKYMKTGNEGICACGKVCKFISLKLGYREYCSHQCQAKYTAAAAKITKETKYGKGNYISDDGKKRISIANTKNKETRVKKAKNTNLQKYGSEWASQNENVKMKVTETNLRKYGNKCSLHGSNQKKTEAALIEKYGVANPIKNEQIKKKIKKTNISRYGAASPFESAICIEKRRQQYFDKTGYFNPAQNPIYHKSHRKRYTYDNMFFDSTWELVFYIFHKDNGFTIDVHPDIAYEYEYDNQKYFYLPDFLVNGVPYEVKGGYFFENGKMINPYDRRQDMKYEAKHQCMIRNGVKIVTDCSPYMKYVDEKYGKDFLRHAV